jgi:hypothetical protein
MREPALFLSRLPPTLRSALESLLVGFVVGFLVLGTLSRLAMRILAVGAGRSGEFSLGGTLEVLLLGGLMGLASGPVYLLLHRFLPRRRAPQGLVFGAVFYLATVALLPQRFQSLASSFGELLPAAILLFAVGFLSHGVVLSILLGGLAERRRD